MAFTSGSFRLYLRSDDIRIQIEKLEQLDHRAPVNPTLRDALMEVDREALPGYS